MLSKILIELIEPSYEIILVSFSDYVLLKRRILVRVCQQSQIANKLICW